MARAMATLLVALLSCAAVRADEKADAPAGPSRAVAEGVIASRYPGFRILTAQDFEEWLRPSLADGVRGGLVTGRFDFDEHRDFAAFIVPPVTKRYEHSSGGGGYDYHEGKLVTCHGGADEGAFRCSAEERHISVPQPSYLERIPPGRHACVGEDDGRVVVTKVDSVGWVFPEKGSGFTFLKPDGTEDACLTGD